MRKMFSQNQIEEIVMTALNPITPNNFFTKMTHSFAELDETLRALVESAIADNDTNGVACTPEQWNAIKSLLDKSLYLNYRGISMIKQLDSGIAFYQFGGVDGGGNNGYTLYFIYDGGEKLNAKYIQI